MQTLFALSIAMMAGLLMSRLTKIWNLPAVTAYLLAGILVGPYVLGHFHVPGLGFTSVQNVEAYSIVSDVALGFIAISMGNEFRVADLKKIGKQAMVIAIFQALTATLAVDLTLYGLHLILGEQILPLSVVLVLGAIATATAPAATLMVVKQYKAEGPLTRMLLPVVALDDVVGLIVFSVSFGIAKALEVRGVEGAAQPGVMSILVNPLIEIVASLLLGALLGFLFHLVEGFFHSRSKRMSISVGFVFLAVAFSKMEFEGIGGSQINVAFSPLLVCMMLGAVFCNLCDFSEELMDHIDRWTAPIMVLFFVLSGAELELSVFSSWQVVLIGLLFVLSRSAGKIVGANLSAKWTKCEPSIQKYLGITLLPQAGVALGMALMAADSLGSAPGQPGNTVRNIALFAILIYELVGPTLTKIALDKAGEISEKPVPPRLLHKHQKKAEKEGQK